MLNIQCFGNPKNPPCVFLHGFLGQSSDFLEIVENLLDQFYCIAVDLPGHGQSNLLPQGFKQVSDEIYASLRQLQIESPYIVGYSLGGRIAMHIEYFYPFFCKKVVVLSSHFGFATCEAKKRGLPKI